MTVHLMYHICKRSHVPRIGKKFCCFNALQYLYLLETTITAQIEYSSLKLFKDELIRQVLDYKGKFDDVSKSISDDMLEIKANILNSVFTKTHSLLKVPLTKL